MRRLTRYGPNPSTEAVMATVRKLDAENRAAWESLQQELVQYVMPPSRRERQKQPIEGSDLGAPTSEDLSDQETAEVVYSDNLVTEKTLHTMLQSLRVTLQKDFKQISSDLPKEVSELGNRTRDYLFADLSAATVARRREFAGITKVLRDHKVIHRWGYPTKLLIWREGKMQAIMEPCKGNETLMTLGLMKPEDHIQQVPASPKKIQKEWMLASSKKSK
ncbi:Hypothetical predicted protein [Pelobates cultripes]|uniref:Uncharacterized protein n=1 Tax=Pelobates cultripes TaxID=61616 RepID=A0AAD1R2V2_PELCU|nr:Hypothetical predicted protein [Pelobates cultripes]